MSAIKINSTNSDDSINLLIDQIINNNLDKDGQAKLIKLVIDNVQRDQNKMFQNQPQPPPLMFGQPFNFVQPPQFQMLPNYNQMYQSNNMQAIEKKMEDLAKANLQINKTNEKDNSTDVNLPINKKKENTMKVNFPINESQKNEIKKINEIKLNEDTSYKTITNKKKEKFTKESPDKLSVNEDSIKKDDNKENGKIPVKKDSINYIKNDIPEEKIKDVREGAEKYCNFILEKVNGMKKDFKKEFLFIQRELLEYKDFKIWHYGPPKKGGYNLRIYEEFNITLGFRQAQAKLKERGIKLLDISDPDKNTEFIMIFVGPMDYKSEQESKELWHGFNKLI